MPRDDTKSQTPLGQCLLGRHKLPKVVQCFDSWSYSVFIKKVLILPPYESDGEIF
ncbi:hypothetical protein [Moraxella lacunata]|uniref:hypothetical protein n=1 Tax=Moraxella lacunata TaxID=477 RepID=UPI003EE19405